MRSNTMRFIGRLAAILLVIFGSIVAFILAWNHSPQVRNMRAVDEWIASETTKAAVTDYQREKGLQFKLFTQTRSQGIVGVQVEGESTARHAEICAFLESLNPPRPIEMNLRWPDGRYEMRAPEAKPREADPDAIR